VSRQLAAALKLEKISGLLEIVIIFLQRAGNLTYEVPYIQQKKRQNIIFIEK